MKHIWAAILVLAVGGVACRSSDTGSASARGVVPEANNRQEAARLERQGHSFEVANPPAWVNGPRPPSAVPSEWLQVGRKSYRLGKAPQLSEDLDLLALLNKPAPLDGKVVRVKAKLHRCGDIFLMRPSGKTNAQKQVLMVQLPLRDPRDIPGEAVVEGKLSVDSKQLTNARLSCGAAHHSPALLVADTVITSRRP